MSLVDARIIVSGIGEQPAIVQRAVQLLDVTLGTQQLVRLAGRLDAGGRGQTYSGGIEIERRLPQPMPGVWEAGATFSSTQRRQKGS